MIPKRIHRIWLGGDEPEWTQPFADSWRLGEWEVVTHTEPPFELANQAIYDQAEEIAPDHVGQLRSDILRYELLYRLGGVYVDCDFQLLKPLDGLLAGIDCFSAWEEQGRWIANGLIGAAPGHPFIAALIAGIPASVQARPGQRPARVTGPQYLTRTWRREGRSTLSIFEQRLLYPFGWREIDDYEPGTFDPAERWPEAIAVHWWANKRRETTWTAH